MKQTLNEAEKNEESQQLFSSLNFHGFVVIPGQLSSVSENFDDKL